MEVGEKARDCGAREVSVELVVGFVFEVEGILYSCRRKCRRFEKANIIAVIKIISSVTRVSGTIYYIERVH